MGADWVAAGHHCLAHNRREALVQVLVTNGTAALPSDLAVTLDGTAMMGEPPTVQTHPGAHQLAVNATGFRPVSQALTFTAGQAERVTVALEALVGRVEVHTTTPNPELTLDGTPLTGTPPARDGVPPGSHMVRAEADGRTPLSREITVTAGQTTAVDLGELALVAPPSPPPSVEPASEAPPPAQMLTIMTNNAEEQFNVRVEVLGHVTRCPAPVTVSTPCVLPNIPRGATLVGVESPTEFSENVRVPTGASTVHIEFHRQPALRGVYVGLAIVSLVPAAVLLGVAASCHSCDDGVWWGFAGTLVVPGVVPGAFFWAASARTQGAGTIRLERGATTQGALYDHANDIPVLRAAAPPAPRLAPAFITF